MNTLAVHRWPGPTPAPQDGLFAILIDTGASPAQPPSSAGAQRDAARLQVRIAARQALAAVLHVQVADVTITSSPGTPPRILVAGAASRIGISFSHEEGYALAAFNLRGQIGADIMRVQPISDWHVMANDYLGPAVTAALQAATDRPRAFIRAWTQREAALKCHAQQLSEWQADLPGAAISLDLPDSHLAGYIHVK